MQNNQPNLLDHVDHEENIQVISSHQLPSNPTRFLFTIKLTRTPPVQKVNSTRKKIFSSHLTSLFFSSQAMLNDFGKKLYLDQTSHPLACIFTFAFKLPACLLYNFSASRFLTP